MMHHLPLREANNSNNSSSSSPKEISGSDNYRKAVAERDKTRFLHSSSRSRLVTPAISLSSQSTENMDVHIAHGLLHGPVHLPSFFPPLSPVGCLVLQFNTVTLLREVSMHPPPTPALVAHSPNVVRTPANLRALVAIPLGHRSTAGTPTPPVVPSTSSRQRPFPTRVPTTDRHRFIVRSPWNRWHCPRILRHLVPQGPRLPLAVPVDSPLLETVKRWPGTPSYN